MAKYKLIINLKTYEKATDKYALKIARAVKSLNGICKKKDVEIILCPQFFDVKEIVNLGISVYSQHVDFSQPGKNTGFIISKNLSQIGVLGSLISHSEHILNLDDIKSRIDSCREDGLISVVCARNLTAIKNVRKFNPDYIAIEPKDLIGGDISISKADPKLISNSVASAKGIPILAGAGVKNKSDVKIAIKLGASGILVASGVVLAKDVKAEILDLLEGF